jgi:hypothetical protein
LGQGDARLDAVTRSRVSRIREGGGRIAGTATAVASTTPVVAATATVVVTVMSVTVMSVTVMSVAAAHFERCQMKVMSFKCKSVTWVEKPTRFPG